LRQAFAHFSQLRNRAGLDSPVSIGHADRDPVISPGIDQRQPSAKQ
jgi:hypothetical protein